MNVSSSAIKNMTDMVETERAEHSTTAVRGNMQDQQHWKQMKDWMSIYMTEGIVVLADTVHHIIPLQDEWEKRNDISNLMSLSGDTHSMIEQMYKKDKDGMEKKLHEMLQQYRSMVRGGAV